MHAPLADLLKMGKRQFLYDPGFEYLREKLRVQSCNNSQSFQYLFPGHILLSDIKRRLNGLEKWKYGIRIDAGSSDNCTACRLRIVDKAFRHRPLETEWLSSCTLHGMPVMENFLALLRRQGSPGPGTQSAQQQLHSQAIAIFLPDSLDHRRKSPAPGTHRVGDIPQNLFVHKGSSEIASLIGVREAIV